VSNPFLAEIRILPFGFAPKGWAQCDGQLMPISQNTALFSILGTTYGGNGTSNFALPNLQGSSPMQAGQGPGLSLRDLGETGGEQAVTLIQTEMPAHTHAPLMADARPASLSAPGPTEALARSSPFTYKQPAGATKVQMNPLALSIAGGNLPHNNMQPFLGLNFCIALQGVFPARS
jgi:microcystin-dependent protein